MPACAPSLFGGVGMLVFAAPAPAKFKLTLAFGDSSPGVGQPITLVLQTQAVVPEAEGLQLIAMAPGRVAARRGRGSHRRVSSEFTGGPPARRLRDQAFARCSPPVAGARPLSAGGQLAGRRTELGAYVWSGSKNLRLKPSRARIKVDGVGWYDGKASCVLFGNVGELFAGVEGRGFDPTTAYSSAVS